MYFVIVILLMLVLPLGSAGAEWHLSHAPIMMLIGKWFVFWGVGARLFLAGLRQLIQPRFTAEKIFGFTSDDPLPIVRELGVANIAMGTLGLVTLLDLRLILPASIVGGVFYGLAGLRHTADVNRNRLQSFAMVTDLLAFAVLMGVVVVIGEQGWLTL